MAQVPRWNSHSSTIAVGGSWSGGEYHSSIEVPSHRGLLVSQGHRRKGSGGWESGGPFHQVTDEWTGSPVHQLTFEQLFPVRLNRDWAVSLAGMPSTFAPLDTPSFSDYQAELGVAYTKGYKRTRPGNPTASVGQFVAELRQVPTLPGRLFAQLKNFRSLGSEYLNVQFGWKPFVNDVKKMYETYKNIDAKLARIASENGKGIRKRANLTDETNVTMHEEQHNVPFARCSPVPAIFGSGRTTYSETTTTTVKSWYSARYRYWIPDVGSSQWTKRATRALYGVNPTPELLWEILPWSWLIDYFSNVGDVMSNASANAVDNLTMDYSYVMKRTKIVTQVHVKTTWEANENILAKIGASSADLHATHTVEVKLRQGGLNPYGIGADFGGLSGYQLSILAALGISRQRFL